MLAESRSRLFNKRYIDLEYGRNKKGWYEKIIWSSYNFLRTILKKKSPPVSNFKSKI